LSKNSLALAKMLQIPMLYSLERECPRLGENLFSLRRKASWSRKNQLEGTFFFQQRVRSSELHLAQARLAE